VHANWSNAYFIDDQSETNFALWFS